MQQDRQSTGLALTERLDCAICTLTSAFSHSRRLHLNMAATPPALACHQEESGGRDANPARLKTPLLRRQRGRSASAGLQV